MDRLSFLLHRFSLSAGVFYSGQICGIHDFSGDTRRGHIHLIKRGPVDLVEENGATRVIDQPSLLFLPRPEAHRLIAHDVHGADVVCATIQFGTGGHNPISDSLPSEVLIPLVDLSGAAPLLDLLQDEAFGDHCGRQAALDRLCELLLIRLLRHCMERGLMQGGAMAGLADPRLAKVLMALHEDPARPWDLPAMAAVAGMSRARFALHFRQITGETPANYLAAWRITMAQDLLRSGRPLQHVASDVGYGSASALTRAFARMTGDTPTQWQRNMRASIARGATA